MLISIFHCFPDQIINLLTKKTSCSFVHYYARNLNVSLFLKLITSKWLKHQLHIPAFPQLYLKRHQKKHLFLFMLRKFIFSLLHSVPELLVTPRGGVHCNIAGELQSAAVHLHNMCLI